MLWSPRLGSLPNGHRGTNSVPPKRTTSKARPKPKPARAASTRTARIVGALLILGAGGVLANNAGLIPADLRDRLLVHLNPDRLPPRLNIGEFQPPSAAPSDDEEPDDGPPVPRAKPPAGLLERLKPEPKPPREPQPAERDEPRPEPKPPARRPEPERAAAVAGALKPSERHSRLAEVVPPAGFTSEWSGGSAALTIAANEIGRGPSDRRRVAITFDGHFEPGPVDQILETLQAHRVSATFFLTGRFARHYPAVVDRIATAGHEIGNHSDGHPELTKLDDERLLRELETAEAAIVAQAGRAYRPYLRVPYGDRDVRVNRLLIQHGYLPVYWTLDSLDWKEGMTAEAVLEKVRAKGLEPGTIVLCHCGSEATARALPRMLVMYEQADLAVGTLSALLER